MGLHKKKTRRKQLKENWQGEIQSSKSVTTFLSFKVFPNLMALWILMKKLICGDQIRQVGVMKDVEFDCMSI